MPGIKHVVKKPPRARPAAGQCNSISPRVRSAAFLDDLEHAPAASRVKSHTAARERTRRRR
jgi:hypothetical protein